MQTYKRTRLSLIKGLVIVPFTGIAVFILGQILLPAPLCAILGIAAAGAVFYITLFSENIQFELDEDGAFRFFKKGTLQNTFELPKYRIGYQRKTEWGFLGSNDIKLRLQDAEGEETEIDAGPLGTAQFEEMFAAMERHAVQSIEKLEAK